MKYIIISFLILVSCSPAWHLNRAIKKDPSIITTHTDTIIKTISDSGKVSFYGDTLIEDSFIVINVKHRDNKIDLDWFLKSLQISVPKQDVTIIPQPTNFTTWQINKTYRKKPKEKVALTEQDKIFFKDFQVFDQNLDQLLFKKSKSFSLLGHLSWPS